MNKIVYMDNAATSFPKPPEVHEFAQYISQTRGVNASRGNYSPAMEVSRMIDDTRRKCLELLHAKNKVLAFCSSATEALNTVIQGLDYAPIQWVYISPFEHNAMLRPIYSLQKMRNFDIMQLAVSPTPLRYDVDEILRQFEQNPPDLVLLTHASNVCGLIAPFEEIFAAAKRHGAITVLDMSQTAGLVDTNISSADVDYAVFAGHKTMMGPFGVAGLVLKRGDSLRPLLYGGTGTNSALHDMPAALPERLEAGSHNIQAIAGLSAAVQWIQQISMKIIRERETDLTRQLKQLLRSYPNIRIVGNNEGVSIVSCVFDGYSPDEIGLILSRRDIAVRTGLHCAPLAHEALGTAPAGTVRFSLSCRNSEDELELLKAALDEIAQT